MKAAATIGHSAARVAPAARVPCRDLPARSPVVAQAAHISSSSNSSCCSALKRAASLSPKLTTAAQWGRSISIEQRRLSSSSQAASDGAPPSDAFEEVKWDPELCNTIYLLGRTGQDFELKYLESGSILGSVTLAVKQPNGDSMWVRLEIWGDMAETAAAAIPKGRMIAIQGRLKIRNWMTQAGEKRTSTSVVVNHLKMVKQDGQRVQSPLQEGQHQSASAAPQSTSPRAARASKGANPDADAKWAAFFQNPDSYYDNRDMKKTGERSPRYPDFKSKDNENPLWVDSYDTPMWVKEAVRDLDRQREGLDGLSDLSPI